MISRPITTCYPVLACMIAHGDFLKHRLLQLVQSCTRVRSLATTKPLHALAITLGSNSDDQSTFIYNNIISLYGSLDEVSWAYKVFESMPQRNKVSHNSMIGCFSRFGYLGEAWRNFYRMRECGFRPNNFTLASLLSCASMDIDRGVQLLALAVKNGLFYADAFVGTSLLGLFGRSGWLDEARRVFEDMPRKSLVTWNSMISLLGNHGFVEDCVLLFRELAGGGKILSEFSFEGVFSGLVSEQYLETGELMHGLVIKMGFDYNVLVVNSLLNMYARCATIYHVDKVFETARRRDVVTWNSIIGAFAKSEIPGKALELFLQMPEDGLTPNHATFLAVINSCTNLRMPMCGELVHALVVKNSIVSEVYVASALVDYYAKCDKLDLAYNCILEINEKNVVCWNALILGYANKCSPASTSLLIEMLQGDCRPNEFSFSAVLRASSTLELKQFHCLSLKMGYEYDKYVLSSLITAYSRNDLPSDALGFASALETPLATVPSNCIAGIHNSSGQYLETLKLLSELEEPDAVSWNIVMEACARNGNFREVAELFKHMHMAEIHPDNYTYDSIITICTKLCNLALGSSVHGLLIKTNFSRCDTFVCNLLIDMYGKCGSVDSSVNIFNSMTERNLITWTVLISALGINGRSDEALQRFEELESLGFSPDKVTFTAVLTACRHGALTKEGIQLFEKMKSYSIEPGLDHYHCLIDLLAKTGHVEEAEKVISSMPCPPNALIWRTFLEGCERHRNAEDQAVSF